MTTLPLHRKTFLACLLVLGVALERRALADDHDMNCDSSAPRTHAQLAAGDQNTATRLELGRKLASGPEVTLSVCAADLTVQGGGNGELRVSVEIANPAAQHTAGDYLQSLDITPRGADLKLHLPRSLHARVVIVVPSATQHLVVNLVRGGLTFESEHIAGARTLNVVDGHVEFLGAADSYRDLELNVVLGSFQDHRERQDGSGMLLSRSFSGKGDGAIEINVVKGSIDLRALE